MELSVHEFHRPDFTISDDPHRLQVAVIHDFLSNRSYWAEGRPLVVVQKSIDHSLCLGIYTSPQPEKEEQVGFARLVTDMATFAWLCDVFIIEEYRGLGLGKWLVECVVQHPDLKGIRRVMLATRDAHELYKKYGEFEMLANPERWMVRMAK